VYERFSGFGNRAVRAEHAGAARSGREKKRFSKLIFWITNYKSFLLANPLESVKPRRKR